MISNNGDSQTKKNYNKVIDEHIITPDENNRFNFPPIDKTISERYNIALNMPYGPEKVTEIRAILNKIETEWYKANISKNYVSDVKKTVFPPINPKDGTAFKRYWVTYENIKDTVKDIANFPAKEENQRKTKFQNYHKPKKNMTYQLKNL